MASNELTVVVDVKNVPEIVFELRREMAKILRDEAEGEHPLVAKKLREVADVFEVGNRG